MKFTAEKTDLRKIINITNKISKINKFEIIYICHNINSEYLSIIGGSNRGLISYTIRGEYNKSYDDDLMIYPIKGSMFSTIVSNAPDGELILSILDNGYKLKISKDLYKSTIRINNALQTNWIKQALHLLLKYKSIDGIHDDQKIEFSIDSHNLAEMCATSKINFGRESNITQYLALILLDNKLSLVNKTPNYIVKNNITINDNKSQETSINIQTNTIKHYFDAIRSAGEDNYNVLITDKIEYIETENQKIQCIVARPANVALPSVAILKAFKTLSQKLISIDINKKEFVKLLQMANSMSINSSAIITLEGNITADKALLTLDHSTSIGKIENKISIKAIVYDNNQVNITDKLEKTDFILNGLNAPRLSDSIRYLEKLDDTDKNDDLYGIIKLDIFVGFRMQKNSNPVNFIQLGFDRTSILYSTNIDVKRYIDIDSEPLYIPEAKYFNNI